MTVRIINATLRDLSYIAANLRPEDRAEIDCQFDQWSPALLALSALQGFAYVAELNGTTPKPALAPPNSAAGCGSPGAGARAA